ncbi:hypothetical protein GIV49_17250 [Pseudomonas syringae]|nr:hypothetical protein [Pseudomonas syringae]
MIIFLVGKSVIRVVRSAKENFSSKAIAPTFRSAAFSYQQRAIDGILTGQLNDGVTGLG